MLRTFAVARCIPSCLAVMAGLTSTTIAKDAVSLMPSFRTPAQFYIEYETRSVQKMTGPDGKPSEIKSRNVIGLVQRNHEEDGRTALALVIDRLLGELSINQAINSFYDTDDPDYEDASPVHKDAFNAILHQPIRMTLDPAAGTATSPEGAAELRKKLTDLGEQSYVAKSLSEAEFSDRQILSVFGESQVILGSDRAVKVGDTWKKTQHDEFPQVGKVLVHYECRFDRLDRAGGHDFAVVIYKGRIEKDESEKPAQDKRLGKIEATFTGDARFDVKQERFVEIRRDTKAKIEIPPWWTKEPNAPLMKLDSEMTFAFTLSEVSVRNKRKAEIAERVARTQAQREAEETAAMSGPVDPVTTANEPTPWRQWGGANRDFSSPATGLANRWPKDGPPKLWQRDLGDGFATILCDGDTLYTSYSLRDQGDAYKGQEVVVALDAKTGKTRWEHKYDAPWPKQLQMEFGPGPHSTPLLVGDRLFSVGSTAILVSLDKNTGKVHWSKNLNKEYKASLLMRGYGSSPMAFNDTILLPINKEKGTALMAFKQSDGVVAMQGGEFDPGYASLLPIRVDGIEQLVAFTAESVIGVDPKDFSTRWTISHPTEWGANISTPLWDAKNKLLFISSAYGMGSRGISLEAAGSQVAAKEVWFNPKMKIQHGDAVQVGDWIYGSSGDFGPTFLASVNVKTGEFGWRQRGIARANVLYADGKLIVLDEDGSLFLVKADPHKYRLLGKATGLLKKTAWTVPTLVGRTLYLRDRSTLLALNLGA